MVSVRSLRDGCVGSIAGGAEVTVKGVDPEILSDSALIVVCPAATEVASPLEPAALLMVATAVLDELQVPEAVRIFMALSVYFPVAINCCVVPLAILGFVGVTSMDVSGACVVTMTQALGA